MHHSKITTVCIYIGPTCRACFNQIGDRVSIQHTDIPTAGILGLHIEMVLIRLVKKVSIQHSQILILWILALHVELVIRLVVESQYSILKSSL